MRLEFSNDPVEYGKVIEQKVMKGNERKYYKIKYTKWYGSIISAYTLGCILRCAYCWNYNKNENLSKYGSFKSPREVAKRINKLLEEHNCRFCRVTGGEAILGYRSAEHLVEIIGSVEVEQFLVETNGIILGRCPEILDMFEDVKDKAVFRVSIKGYDYSHFERVTDRPGCWLDCTFNCIRELSRRKFAYWVCVMGEIFQEEGIQKIKSILSSLGYQGHIEVESLNLNYPGVKERLEKRGFKITKRCRDFYFGCST